MEKKDIVIKLDYTLKTPQERNELVKQILDNASPERLTPQYLNILADYIVFAMDKEEKKEKKILTQNRLVTIKKRETSYQGLASKLESGEDGIYNMMSDLGKSVMLSPKIQITEKDIEEIAGMKELRKTIKEVEEEEKGARGKRKFLLKKQLIEMRREQYVLKDDFHTKPSSSPKGVVRGLGHLDLTENITIDENGNIHSDCLINVFNPKHISAILSNYSSLKEGAYGDFNSDLWFFMEGFDDLVERALKEKYPAYFDLLIYKIDGLTNNKIRELLVTKHGLTHSAEYISSLWRNKIPKIISNQAEEDYLNWYFTFEERGAWKKCSRCGQIKLAHNKFFTKNSTSRDGWYSICKECRNKKTKEKKGAK